MDWASVGEVVKGIAPVATAGAAVVAAIIAVRGLNSWKKKRRVELADEVLADFNKARDIIRRLRSARRSPVSFGHQNDIHTKHTSETEEEAPPDDDAMLKKIIDEEFSAEPEEKTQEETRRLNGYSAVAEGLSKEAEFFDQLEARRHRFIAANFGADADKPYKELKGIRGEIEDAAWNLRVLYLTSPERHGGSNSEKIEEWGKIEEWEKTICKRPGPDDPITKRLDKMVAEIDGICKRGVCRKATK